MKKVNTPIQELIEQLNNVKPQDFCYLETFKAWAESLLEKEKQMIIDAFDEGCDIGHDIGSNHDYHDGHNQGYDYYNLTFNAKEK
jgi:hypothetical protein